MSKANEDKKISTKMNELSELVSWFESDEFELETALEKYADAEKLAKDIEQDLSSLKNEVTVLKKKFDS